MNSEQYKIKKKKNEEGDKQVPCIYNYNFPWLRNDKQIF